MSSLMSSTFPKPNQFLFMEPISPISAPVPISSPTFVYCSLAVDLKKRRHGEFESNCESVGDNFKCFFMHEIDHKVSNYRCSLSDIHLQSIFLLFLTVFSFFWMKYFLLDRPSIGTPNTPLLWLSGGQWMRSSTWFWFSRTLFEKVEKSLKCEMHWCWW